MKDIKHEGYKAWRNTSISGLMVKFPLAKRKLRVRFPADALNKIKPVSALIIKETSFRNHTATKKLWIFYGQIIIAYNYQKSLVIIFLKNIAYTIQLVEPLVKMFWMRILNITNCESLCLLFGLKTIMIIDCNNETFKL